MNTREPNNISNSDRHPSAVSTAASSDGHTFHIPIMGTGFTVDTPVRVARYGISSVLSIGDDVFLEGMRRKLSDEFDKPFTKIGNRDNDPRASRITAYLNLVNELVNEQIESLRSAPFEPGSDICRHFELLPDSPTRKTYQTMMDSTDPEVRTKLEADLRTSIKAGSIDVNIMTKVDGPLIRAGIERTPEQTVAMSSLRGFARSDLRSSVVFSAGMNRRLFTGMEQFDDFYSSAEGDIKKKVVLKVSDFRSAQIQGKLLASKGIWVSEYRVESGLNCGGHAFPTKGHLMGPILDEFRTQRQALIERLHKALIKSLESRGRPVPSGFLPTRFTVQGGIGTAEEDAFLRRYYEIDGTGWGTPFLLVPEVTNVDEELLVKLAKAKGTDVYLSGASPLGVPFWNLRTSASEEARRKRIESGKPGSACPKGYLRLTTEYDDKYLCTASKAYQARKLDEITASDLNDAKKATRAKEALAKACICHELSGSASIKHGLDKSMAPAICPGPGIVDYSKVTTLDEMIDHIYGRLSLPHDTDRPHMFVRELMLYLDYLKRDLEKSAEGLVCRTGQYLTEFKENVLSGIEYYRDLADKFGAEQRESFLDDLNKLGEELKGLMPDIPVVPVTLAPAIAGDPPTRK